MPNTIDLTINVTKVPEALALMRRELAKILRDAAREEPPAVAVRLRKIAAAFEAGQRPVRS